MYALDTNTVIHFFKKKGNVYSRFITKKPNDIFIPIVVVYEMEVGFFKSDKGQERREEFEELIKTCPICPFGKKESRTSALIRSTLEKRGQSIGPLDTLIAGSALANGLILVTRNTKEFERVPGLQVENWYD